MLYYFLIVFTLPSLFDDFSETLKLLGLYTDVFHCDTVYHPCTWCLEHDRTNKIQLGKHCNECGPRTKFVDGKYVTSDTRSAKNGNTQAADWVRKIDAEE